MFQRLQANESHQTQVHHTVFPQTAFSRIFTEPTNGKIDWMKERRKIFPLNLDTGVSISIIFYSQFYSFLLISWNFLSMQLFRCVLAQHKRYTVMRNVFSSNIYTPAEINHFLHLPTSTKSKTEAPKTEPKKESAYTSFMCANTLSLSLSLLNDKLQFILLAHRCVLNVVLQF